MRVCGDGTSRHDEGYAQQCDAGGRVKVSSPLHTQGRRHFAAPLIATLGMALPRPYARRKGSGRKTRGGGLVRSLRSVVLLTGFGGLWWAYEASQQYIGLKERVVGRVTHVRDGDTIESVGSCCSVEGGYV